MDYSILHEKRISGIRSRIDACVVKNVACLSSLKPVTDEQVFYDKFYLPSARVYVRQILYDKFLVF